MKNKNNQQSLEEFTALRLSLASPEEIVEWSHGEVLKPETINYRTFRTEKDGLFDERIFGPTKDFECYCGKYKRIRYRGVICDKCGVEVTYSRVRRERMGHIRLASPCAHVWFFRGIPSQMGTLLDISPREIDSVVYFSSYLVVAIDPDKKTEVLSELAKEHEKELSRLRGEVGQQIEKIEEEARLKAKGKKELSAEAIKLSARRQGAQAREQLVKEIDILSQEYQLLEGQLKGVDKLAVVSDRLYEEHYREIDRFARVQMGAEALKSVLEKLDLPSLSGEIKSQLAETSGQKRIKLVKRLRLVEGLLNSGVKPGWMVLTVLPIIPPDLRPLVQLEGGRFAASDLNDLYRRVINRNNRLARLLDLGAPEVIVRNEKRMLQEAVDSLIDVGRRTRPMRGRQELRSLSDMLKGKQGRFRQNLLGKRVDYSGRSVIIPGPRLNLDQCGLPREMALELFKPFILHEILKEGLAPNIKSARFLLEQQTGEVWDILERLVKDRPVLLNRAPTLHRLGIQAFYPQLINGKAIQLHPCVCPGFNADFDGDQMAVHVPLASQPRREAHDIMLSAKNLLRPSDGVPITVPNKEMVIGTYYLTSMRGERERKTIFASETEALYAYQQKYVGLRGPVSVKLGGKILQTTVGRVIFNSILPSSLRFFNDETNRENGAVRRLIERCLTLEGEKRTAQLIDDIKSLGFSFATQGGISIGIFDGEVVKEKQAIVEEANQKVAGIDTSFRRGLITRQEKLRLTEQIWVDATQRLDELTWENLGEDNPIKLMVTSGARGTRDQVKQIAGIRGLIVDPSGGLVELPIRSNYREGLSGFEYFSGARGARKGLVDTALKTADAGYLTRRLVDAAQDVVVREEDCGTREGLELMHGEGTLLSSFAERLVGRLAALDVRSGRKTLVKAGELIDKQKAAEIGEVGVERVTIRSPITCETRRGICIKCYGIDPATQKEVLVGTPVGIMAAQSIGEPGTQLTLRTRHVGGIVTAKDVTQGLPRVEEIFEARTPKELALMSPIAGRVEVVERDETRFLRIKPTQASQEEVEFEVDPVAELKVADNDLVGPGTTLTDGFLDLTELMEGLGQAAAQKYVLNGIQNVYSSQGVTLSDKHIEVIVRQMFSKVRVVNSGGTPLLPGEIVSGHVVEETNKRAEEEGKPPATFKPIILGVTKAALETESFLAAASFINTTRVLTEAAVSGKIDRLLGLKENVIIGRLIPVGERVKV